MAEQIVLAVHMEAEGRTRLYSGGFCSTDQLAGPISTVLRRNRLHYNSIFVSIAVYSVSENPHDNRAPAYQAFGPPVVLHGSVANEITIACSMDFQNAISNRHNPRDVFRDLRDKSPDEIEAHLLALLRKRPSTTWAEARIYRVLTADDVLDDRYR